MAQLICLVAGCVTERGAAVDHHRIAGKRLLQTADLPQCVSEPVVEHFAIHRQHGQFERFDEHIRGLAVFVVLGVHLCEFLAEPHAGRAEFDACESLAFGTLLAAVVFGEHAEVLVHVHRSVRQFPVTRVFIAFQQRHHKAASRTAAI